MWLEQGQGGSPPHAPPLPQKAEFECRKAARPDYYELLGCKRVATTAEVKNCYKARALEWHPDRHVEAAPEKRAEAEARFKLIGEALEVLGDQLQRQLYDEARKGPPRSLERAALPPRYFAGRGAGATSRGVACGRGTTRRPSTSAWRRQTAQRTRTTTAAPGAAAAAAAAAAAVAAAAAAAAGSRRGPCSMHGSGGDCICDRRDEGAYRSALRQGADIKYPP